MLLPALHLAWGYKPEIQAFPSKVVGKGDNVIIRCSSSFYRGRYRLRREDTSWIIDGDSDVSQHNFTVTVGDNYYCTLYNGIGWSEHSDILTLKVIDPQKPKISSKQQDMQLLITCRAPNPPEECRVKRFYLYSGKERIKDLLAIESSPEVTFTVSSLTAEYRCSYELEVLDGSNHLIESQQSHKVKPTKNEDRERTQSTTPGEEEGSEEEGKGEENKDLLGVLIPVVAAVCGILIMILVVFLVVYFMRKKKQSPQKMKSSEFPQSEQAETTPEATYITIDDSKMRANPDVAVDMKDTNFGDDNDDGITYARLNKDILKQKNTESDTPTDTSLYAEVKKSKPK